MYNMHLNYTYYTRSIVKIEINDIRTNMSNSLNGVTNTESEVMYKAGERKDSR